MESYIKSISYYLPENLLTNEQLSQEFPEWTVEKIDKEKFFVFMENVGNTVSSTIPIALYEAKQQGILKGNILLAGFGVGYSWGGVKYY